MHRILYEPQMKTDECGLDILKISSLICCTDTENSAAGPLNHLSALYGYFYSS